MNFPHCTKWLLLLLSLTTLLNRAAPGSCSSGRLAFERTPGHRAAATGSAPSRESASGCRARCLRNAACGGFQVDQARRTCVLLLALPENPRIESGPSWSLHTKICLGGSYPPCPGRHWEFERVPGFQLLAYDDRPLRGVATRRECLERCRAERDFACRSASFDPARGACALSRHDRRTAPEAFRRAEGLHYLENQCVAEPSRCTFVKRPGRLPASALVEEAPNGAGGCESTCERHAAFRCRTFAVADGRCLLSPDSSSSLFPVPDPTRHHFERGSCVEVRMECGPSRMRAVVRVSSPFRGRVYAAGHPHLCYAVSVRGAGELALDLPLRDCGTEDLGNGTFSNVVVVQQHPLVLRGSDRMVDVACDYAQVRKTLRGGKRVLEGSAYREEAVQVVTGLAAAPPVRLRLVEASGNEVRGAVALGAPLSLRLELKDDSVFSIFGSKLVASSGAGAETYQLIDEIGCPVEPEIFPALSAQAGGFLEAPFRAFKFASDSRIRFQVTVSFCLGACLPADCGGGVLSRGRRKRSVLSDVTMETSLLLVGEEHPKRPRSSVCLGQAAAFSASAVGVLVHVAAFLIYRRRRQNA